MTLILNILLILSLVLIIFQDFKYRSVSIYLLIFSSLGFIILGYLSSRISIVEVGINILFVFILLLAVYLYLLIKNLSLESSILDGIGAADIVLFFALSFYIQPEFFILLLISSFISSLISSYLIQDFKKKVPLAAFLSLSIIVFNMIRFSNILQS